MTRRLKVEAPAIDGLGALPLRRDERRVLEQAGQTGKSPTSGIQSASAIACPLL